LLSSPDTRAVGVALVPNQHVDEAIAAIERRGACPQILYNLIEKQIGSVSEPQYLRSAQGSTVDVSSSRT
jgi:hypothetical protein